MSSINELKKMSEKERALWLLKEYDKILKADELLKKKLKMTEKYNRQVIIDALNRSKCLNSNVHLNNN